ncbi:MAG TPA: glycosyltransferase family 1 protein [Chryseosolibacter sp.]
MNIGFEAKRFFTNYTGLGNYSRFVIDALSKTSAHDNLYLFTPRSVDHAETRDILKRQNVNVVAPSGLYAQPFISALWRTWAVSKNPAMKQLHVFHGLSQELPIGLPSQLKKVVTVHDLIFLRYPQFYNAVDVSIYTRKVRSACENADRIIAISQQTADDVKDLLKLTDPSKIDVVYQGCHPIFKTRYSQAELQAVRQKYSLPDQFILNVGTVEERKNLMLIIKALASLPAHERLPLIVVGRHTSYQQTVLGEIKQRKLEGVVHFLTAVNFHDLPAIYQQAHLFIYPSFFEGFGIPLVEAIASGLPVITSTGSCFREAAGPGGVYVDPSSAENLASEIRSVLLDTGRKDALISQGREYIKRFEPETIAQNLRSVYRDLVPQPTSV